ncbi:hypothetical protein LRQ11_23615 [Pseudomonas sp. MAFF 311095]|uniref:Uncharacterized protein n=1 Tax=Pseudomonas petroselini TaxID=2899822 RepID=A0ABS8QX59_9PSED|nr:hypothetical protein [Pseudomonas petroselini]MCD7040050.1 hypothetical protein [Pseudomonas petroselini]MCD7046229.1 hypothetical protein [Pseudomonas petroselini]MCD7067673.1 hypothetical protein [Pseudomonas petroselini]MCD7081630.1 hypothetical protein [Pseudomonas petroselini]
MSWESISFWIEHHPGLASWVQAIGSLLALAVAIGVARKQGRQSRKLFRDQVNHASEEARLQRIASLRATVEVAEIVARRVIEVAKKMPDIIVEGSAPRHRDALEAAVLWIAKLPIYELPGALVARDVQNIALAANRMLKVLDRISTEGILSGENYKSLCGISDSAEKALKGASSFVDEYRGGTDVIRAADL